MTRKVTEWSALDLRALNVTTTSEYIDKLESLLRDAIADMKDQSQIIIGIKDVSPDALTALRMARDFISSLSEIGGCTLEETRILEVIDQVPGVLPGEHNEPDPDHGPINLDKEPA